MDLSGNKNNRQNVLLAFGSTLVVLLTHHLLFYLGHYGFDDMTYARMAFEASQGNWNVSDAFFQNQGKEVDINDHFLFRITLIGFTAISYVLFGVADWASALPTMMVTLGSIGVVSVWLRSNKMALFLSLALIIFNRWFLFYSDKLMPDLYIVLAVTGAFWVLYCARENKMSPLRSGILFALFLFFGFNSKGTIVLILPVLGFWLVFDWIDNRHRHFWKSAIISSVALLILYLAFFQVAYGDPFYRFNSIYQNAYLNKCSYAVQPSIVVLKRIGYGLLSDFTKHGMLLPFAFILPLFFSKHPKAWFSKPGIKSFLVLSSLFGLIAANFMSISLTSYSPMCIDPRHYLYLIPLWAVTAALNFNFKKAYLLQVSGVLFVLMVVAYAFDWSIWYWGYFPVLTVVLSIYLAKAEKVKRNLYWILIPALALQPVDMLIYANDVQYNEQKQGVRSFLQNVPSEAIVVSDKVQINFCKYWTGFDEANTPDMLTYDAFNAQHQAKQTYWIDNYHTRNLSAIQPTDVPFSIRSATKQKVKTQPASKMVDIYRIEGFNEFKPVFNTGCDLDRIDANWSVDSSAMVMQPVKSGKKAYRVYEYSPTLGLGLDSLDLDPARITVVSLKAQLWLKSATDQKLVIELKGNGETYLWQGKTLDEYIKSYGAWWPVSFDLVLGPGEIKPASTLNAYYWNAGKKLVYIDDMEVDILQSEHAPEL